MKVGQWLSKMLLALCGQIFSVALNVLVILILHWQVVASMRSQSDMLML